MDYIPIATHKSSESNEAPVEATDGNKDNGEIVHSFHSFNVF